MATHFHNMKSESRNYQEVIWKAQAIRNEILLWMPLLEGINLSNQPASLILTC